MKVSTRWAVRALVLGSSCVVLLGTAHQLKADGFPLTLSFSSTSLTGSAGSTIVFAGTVTNDTGASLDATDIFLNFNGFNPSVFASINQLLGAPDFTISDKTTSSTVDLFNVQIASGVSPGSYALDVSLEDLNNDLSNTFVLNVDVPSSTKSPEPQTILMLGAGLMFARLWYSKRVRDRNLNNPS